MNTKNNNKNNSTSILKYISLGTEILVTLGLTVWGGITLDNYIETLPLFTIILPLIGLFSIFRRVLSMVNKDDKSQKK